MKNRFAALTLILSIGWVAPSFATVDIIWFASADDPVFQSNNATLAPSGWTAQLIYSTSSTGRDPINPGSPFAPGANETVLATQAMNTISSDGLIIGNDGHAINIADGFAGGYVYTRVFNSTFGTAEVPTLYGLSTNQDGPLTVSGGLNPPFNQHKASGIVVDQAFMAIPEPSTYALLGLGAVVAFLRHRKMHAKS